MVLLALLACFPDLPERPGADSSVEADADTDTDTDTDADSDSDTDTDLDDDSWTLAAGDCEDDNPSVNPGAPEVLNNDVDEDCDGLAVLFHDGFEDGGAGEDIVTTSADWGCFGTSVCDATYGSASPHDGEQHADLGGNGGDLTFEEGMLSGTVGIRWWSFDDNALATGTHLLRVINTDDRDDWWLGIATDHCPADQYCFWVRDAGAFALAPRSEGWHVFEVLVDTEEQTIRGCVDRICNAAVPLEGVVAAVQYIDDEQGLAVDDFTVHRLGVDHDGDGVAAHRDCDDADADVGDCHPADDIDGCERADINNTTYAYCETPSSWDQGRATCQESGWDLAVLDSEVEDARVEERWQAVDAYIGLRYQAGSWAWVDGQSLVFSDWGANQGDGTAGDCASLYASWEFWVNGACEAEKGFICERP